MNNKDLYLIHLINSLHFHEMNSLRQKGKSDIDPFNYEGDIIQWFKQLYDIVLLIPPQYYVDAVNVYEDENEQIMRIEYDYYPVDVAPKAFGNAIINLSK